jgi:hypothetical protein
MGQGGKGPAACPIPNFNCWVQGESLIVGVPGGLSDLTGQSAYIDGVHRLTMEF